MVNPTIYSLSRTLAENSTESWDEPNPNKPGHINRHKALQAQLCRFQEATQSPLVGQGLVVRLMGGLKNGIEIQNIQNMYLNEIVQWL